MLQSLDMASRDSAESCSSKTQDVNRVDSRIIKKAKKSQAKPGSTLATLIVDTWEDTKQGTNHKESFKLLNNLRILLKMFFEHDKQKQRSNL